ncbi:MAG: MFS transporter, partial [Candidatus Obscuribacterales bacterium]|nr:MFS transporter [Candidatus Obscuribacterales bacterium]
MLSLTGKAAALLRNVKALKSLESGDFRLYLFGQGVSATGTGLQQVALAWLVYRTTHSAGALAAMTAMMLAGQFLLSFAGGCLADRLDRRRLLVALQYAGALLSLSVVAVILLQVHSLAVLFVIAVAIGSYAALEYPARQSLTAALVHPEQVVGARGLYSCVCASAIALGQASGGLLIDLFPSFGEATCAFLNAVSFIVSVISLNKLLKCKSLVNKTAPSILPEKKKLTSEIEKAEDRELSNKECFLFALRSGSIFITFLQTAVLVLFGMRYFSLLPAFAAEIFRGGARETGILTAAVAIGFSAGALLCGNFRQKEKLEMAADLSLLLMPLGLLSFCFAEHLHLAIFSVLLIAVCQSININACICIMQLSAPDRLFGRLIGMRITVIAFCDLIAALFVTMIVQQIGLRNTVIYGSLICLLTALMLFSRRTLAGSRM